jgi:hypothetical protein
MFELCKVTVTFSAVSVSNSNHVIHKEFRLKVNSLKFLHKISLADVFYSVIDYVFKSKDIIE